MTLLVLIQHLFQKAHGFQVQLSELLDVLGGSSVSSLALSGWTGSWLSQLLTFATKVEKLG